MSRPDQPPPRRGIDGRPAAPSDGEPSSQGDSGGEADDGKRLAPGGKHRRTFNEAAHKLPRSIPRREPIDGDADEYPVSGAEAAGET